MTDPNWWIDTLGVPKAAALASLLGALLSLRWVQAPLATKAVMTVGGLATAIYCAPFIVEAMGIKEGKDIWCSGLGFFLGLYGMSLIDAVYASIKDGTLIAALRARAGL